MAAGDIAQMSPSTDKVTRGLAIWLRGVEALLTHSKHTHGVKHSIN